MRAAATVADRRRRLRRALVALVALALTGLLAAQLASVLALTLRASGSARPIDRALAALALREGGRRRVRLRTDDGLVLRGDLLGDPRRRPLVVYAHGYRGSRRDGDRLAATLLARGYAVLAFDFRGSGESDGRFTTAGATEASDVAAAVRYVRRTLRLPLRRCGFIGFSMGAAAGTMAASSLRRFASIVLIAPYARLSEAFDTRMRRTVGVPAMPLLAPALLAFRAGFGVSPADVSPLDRIAGLAPAPVLLVGARDDWRAPPSVLGELFARARRPKRLVVLPRGDHRFLAGFPDSLITPVLDELDANLGRP